LLGLQFEYRTVVLGNRKNHKTLGRKATKPISYYGCQKTEENSELKQPPQRLTETQARILKNLDHKIVMENAMKFRVDKGKTIVIIYADEF